MQSTKKSLFDSYTLGDLTLPNRIIMSAMTRCRANPKDNVPTEIHAKYYSMRASAGLILTECSPVSPLGNSNPGAGGIYSKEQIAGWKMVTDAVHEKGGRIFLQIWHGGRTANPNWSGYECWGPSALPVRKLDKDGNESKEATPKEMTLDDIKLVIEEFRQGAIKAKEAGFDGLELHGANGYLVDEFIRDGSNNRTDEYGGSVENRCRFALEVMDALISVFGAKRVGIKLSPVGRYMDMYDSKPIETYSYLLKELSKRGIAFVEIAEAANKAYEGKSYYEPGSDQIPCCWKVFRPLFEGTYVANQGFNAETATKVIQKEEGDVDLVSFGSAYINNPDLVERIKNGWTLNMNLDRSTFYAGGEKGYIEQQPFEMKANP